MRPIVQLLRYGRHRLSPRVSYADDLEDVTVAILLGKVTRFIDVGANDGTSCSNTTLAALGGAWGLCFEPNPADYAKLKGFYRWAQRVECIAEGLSETEGMVELRSDGLLSAVTSTEDAELARLLARFKQADAPVIKVPVARLSSWLERRPEFRACDLLSIDVEGHELSVLRGIDWVRDPKPARCLVVETHGYNKTQQWRHRDYDGMADLLARYNYRKLAASRNNTFWLHAEDALEARIGVARARCPHYTWF